MLLVVDVGNTQTNFGIVEGAGGTALGGKAIVTSVQLSKTWSVPTKKDHTCDSLLLQLEQVFNLYEIEKGCITEVTISCVVPGLLDVWKKANERYFKSTNKPCLFHSLDNKSAQKLPAEIFTNKFPKSDEVGADYIAACIGALVKFGKPAVVVDLGTATNIAVIDETGKFIGGTINPGIETSLSALIEKASALSDVEMALPKKPIGDSTITAIQSGLIYGEAARTEGLRKRFETQLGYSMQLIITGGWSGLVSKALDTDHIHDANLVLEGLAIATPYLR